MCQECEEAITALCPSVVTISDAALTGAHGSNGTDPIPNTDPRIEPYSNLTGSSVQYYEAPGLGVPQAEALVEQAMTPLEVSAGPFSEGVGGIVEVPEVQGTSPAAQSGTGAEDRAAVLSVFAAVIAAAFGLSWLLVRRLKRGR